MIHDDCRFIKGARNGAIYDLASGDIYSVNQSGVAIVDKFLSGCSIKKISKALDIEQSELYKYLKILKKLKLGAFSNKFLRTSYLLRKPKFNLDFLWLELTDACNLKCIHCYARSDHKSGKKDKLNINDWKRIINESYSTGCRKIQFIGGEPFLIGNKIFDLIRHAINVGFNFVEIFTNGTLLDENKIDLLKRWKANIAISFYSINRSIHESITTVKGSYDKTLSTIKRLKQRDIPFRIAVVVMKENQDSLLKTIEYLKNITNNNNIIIDNIRPVGRGCQIDLFPKRKPVKRDKNHPYFSSIYKKDFSKRYFANSCWPGEMCVKSDGIITPCIMERELILGDIKNKSLVEIINNNNTIFAWGLSKDFINICKDCEFRYACFDCRPKAKGLSGDLFSKPPDCSYDPYRGVWKKRRLPMRL